MKTLFASVAVFAALVSSQALAKGAEPAPKPSSTAAPALVPFASKESMARLERSHHKIDFFHLANQYEGQTNKAFCGPTSAVIVLNALRVDNDKIEKPEDPLLLPPEAKSRPLPPGMDPLFHRYTQNDFFDKGGAVKTKEEVFGKPKKEGARPSGGIQLRELTGMLQAHGLDAQARVADDKLSDAQIKAELIQNLGTENDYVVVNYFRPVIGQKGGGHISPLAAYDEKSDSFLVLDVNPNGQPWVWIPSDALIKSMRTKDTDENRGYVLVKEGPGATAP